MILNAATKSIEVLLGEVITTNDLDVTAAWGDYAAALFLPGAADTVTNGVTPVTVVAAPTAGEQRLVSEITVHNNDTVSHTVILQLNDNSTTRIFRDAILPVGADLFYAPGGGQIFGAPAALHLSASVLVGSAVALSTGVAADVTTLSVGAGSWLIGGAVYFHPAGTTTVTSASAAVNTSTAIGTAPGSFADLYLGGVTGATLAADVSLTGLGIPVTLATPTTYHLVADAVFAISTLAAYGIIWAIPTA